MFLVVTVAIRQINVKAKILPKKKKKKSIIDKNKDQKFINIKLFKCKTWFYLYCGTSKLFLLLFLSFSLSFTDQFETYH